MRNRMLPVIIAALSLCTLFAGAATAGDTREILAQHRFEALDGGTFELSDFRGEVVVVNFWATWCAPCRKELPVLADWNAAWAGRGARVVAISIDGSRDKVSRFVEQTNLGVTVAHDGPDNIARKLDLPSMPCTFLLDAGGRVVRVIEGSSKQQLAELKREAEALIDIRRTAQRAGMVATPELED